MRLKNIKSAIFFWFLAAIAWAQNNPEPISLTAAGAGAYSIVERSDWRRYNDGRYAGLVRQEVRASIIPKQPAQSKDTFLYQGNYYVLESTLRDMRQSAQAVDAVIPVSFELWKNGAIVIENDQGFPKMRGFPAFPVQKVLPGSKWQAPGTRVVDPFNTGQPLTIPFTAEYEYRGIEEYRGMKVHRIFAAYSSRYQNGTPREDGCNRVQGSHKVDILIRLEDGMPIFMRDDLDVTYFKTDGSNVQFKGFTLTFGAEIVPMNRAEVIASLGNTLSTKKPPTPGVAPSPLPTGAFQDSAIDLTPVPEGIRLTIKDIRFAPDSADFLPAERPRLDLIAEALQQVKERSFLVEGHTAATGRPGGEMELSIDRAKRMIDELVKRGISAERFIYKGWGGTKPIGDNASDAGRSANRRVEITILE